MVKRMLKWTLIAVVVLAATGFVAFLYFIPPLTTLPPEDFVRMQKDVLPSLAGIDDPAIRAIAERGQYLVLTSDCAGCHFPPGPENAGPAMYLAGGMRFVTPSHGTVVSRNLTPDPETGLGRRSDAEINRALRAGVRAGGWAMSHTSMPWPLTTNWTDEEIHAVVTYLRHIPAVRHRIPDPAPGGTGDPRVVEAAYGGKDAGTK